MQPNAHTAVTRASGRPPAQAWRRALDLGVVATAYVVTARLGLALDPASGVATTVWPPSGIALGAVLIGGRRLLPAIAVGAFLANLMVGVPPLAALGIAAGNTLEALVAAALLRRFTDFRPSLDRLRDVVAFVALAALASTTVSATIGVASGWLGGIVSTAEVGHTWRSWWVGDVLGDLLVAAPILLWSSLRAQAWPPRRILEAALVLAAVLSVSRYVFGRDDPADVTSAYLVFPPLVLAVLRFGQPGATYATLLAATVAVVGTAQGLGPFAVDGLGESLLLLQTFMAVASLTMLLFGAVISERGTATERLREERDFAAMILDTVGIVVALDGSLRIERLNRACLEATGFVPADFEGREFAELFALPEDAELVRALLARAVAGGEPREWESPYRTASGEMRHVRWSCGPITSATGRVRHVICSGTDLTDRKRLTAALAEERNRLEDLNEALEERVAERTAQLRALAGALSLAEQQERARLSQVLHDDLQQLLYGQLLHMRLLRDGLVGGDLAAAAIEVEELDRLLRDSIGLTRSLVVDLNPPVLTTEGLGEALRWLAEAMGREHGLEVAVTLEAPVMLASRDAEMLLLQMARELLFNVVKHAGTRQATVALRQEDGQVTLEVADEGAGFDLAAVRSGQGAARRFGLFSIEERLSLIGGRIDIETRPGAGTKVTISVPLDRAGG